MYLTTQALVLRVTDYNDSDALITLLTREHGKLTAKARGLRRKRSPLVAPCQLLAYGSFTLFEYKGMYTINEANTIELFRALRDDLTRLALGTYFAQVADTVAREELEDPELLSLVLNCLYGLSGLGLPEEKVKAVFELRCACIAGYTPELYGCHVCGSQSPCLLDLSGGALLCGDCRDKSNGIRSPVSPTVLDAMRYIVYCDTKKLFAFMIGPKDMEVLASVTEAYLITQLERGFPTLDFYKSLYV